MDGMMIREKPLILRTTLILWGLMNTGEVVAAPAQLLNKTVQFSWSTEIVRRGPDGQVSRLRFDANRLAYVSSAGRVFVRSSSENRSGTVKQRGDYAADTTVTASGEARALRITGNNLVGSLAFAQGAVQMTVSFDPSFSSCSLSVVVGREGGGMRRRGADGEMYEIPSMTVAGQSCSVRAGNPFAE
jgi:hypothetical protein